MYRVKINRIIGNHVDGDNGNYETKVSRYIYDNIITIGVYCPYHFIRINTRDIMRSIINERS